MERRSLNQLINTGEPAWPLLQEWLASARNRVEVLPGDRTRGEKTLLGLQITTRSPMGAITLETGGILFDHGWLRFLGSGSERLRGNLLSWNGLGEEPVVDEPLDGALVVAHDAVGGFFALNGGAFEGKQGDAFYMAPDTLAWEDLGLSYSDLLHWAANGDLATFYENARWPGWEDEVSTLSGDQGFSIYPPLWAKGDPVGERSRHSAPMSELWGMQREIARQMRDLPEGAEVRIEIGD